MSVQFGGRFERLLQLYLPQEKLDKLGIILDVNMHYKDIYDTPPTRVRELQSFLKIAREQRKKAALFFLRIDSPSGTLDFLGAPLGHIVALKIDFENNQVFYQDPQGNDMPALIRSNLTEVFPDFPIHELRVIQQSKENHIDCGVLGVENLVRMANGLALEPSPDATAIRAKQNHDLSQVEVNAASR